jgi:hypothetical protein
MSDRVQITGFNPRALVIASSIVATVPDGDLKDFGPLDLADFWIGPGSWIVQAKATVRNPMDEPIDVKFHLTVQGGATAEDATLTTVRSGYAAVALALGVHLAGNGHVELKISKQFMPTAFVSNVVIVAIKQETVTSVNF